MGIPVFSAPTARDRTVLSPSHASRVRSTGFFLSEVFLGADSVLPAYRDGAKTYVHVVVIEFDC